MGIQFLNGSDHNGQRAQNAADPTADQDLATKKYVDGKSGGGSSGGVYAPTPAVGSWLLAPAVGGTNQSSFANGDLVLGPVFLPAGIYSTVAVNVASAGSTNAVLRIVIYGESGGQPGALLAQSAAIDATTSGIKQIALASTFSWAGGIVFAGVVTQGSPSTLPQYTRPNSNPIASVFPAAPTDFGSGSAWAWVTSGVTAAPPSNWASTNRTDVFPRLAFKRSA